MPSTNNIIDKIAKLLALADAESGGTEAERDLAMQRAQELMLKHNLDAAAISQNKRSAPGDVTEDAIHIDGALNLWKADLLFAVGRVCFVDGVYWKTGKNAKKVVLIGRPDNLAFVKMLVEHLVPWLEEEEREANRETAAERAEYGEFHNKRAFKRSFMQAAVGRIHSRLTIQRTASDVGTDLVVNEKAANDEYMTKYNPRSAGRRRGSGDGGGHSAGRDAGDRADLSPGRKLNA